MKLPSHSHTEWEESTIPTGNSITHNIISGKQFVFISFYIETGIE